MWDEDYDDDDRDDEWLEDQERHEEMLDALAGHDDDGDLEHDDLGDDDDGDMDGPPAWIKRGVHGGDNDDPNDEWMDVEDTAWWQRDADPTDSDGDLAAAGDDDDDERGGLSDSDRDDIGGALERLQDDTFVQEHDDSEWWDGDEPERGASVEEYDAAMEGTIGGPDSDLADDANETTIEANEITLDEHDQDDPRGDDEDEDGDTTPLWRF